jgi:hypothetical protein
MNDPPVVCVLHGVAHHGHQLQARSRIELATSGVLVQGYPANKLHGKERPAIFTHARFIDLGEAAVLKSGQDLHRVLETNGELGRDEIGADHLEGDGPARVLLLGLVDGAHAPFAPPAHDAVAADVRRRRRFASHRSRRIVGDRRVGSAD